MRNRILNLAPFIVALLITGCSASSNIRNSEPNPYLAKFLEINSWHCEKPFLNFYALQSAVSNDFRLVPSIDYKDVYETFFNDVSYAVTPESDGCTTDVMLKQKGKRSPLITLEEIDLALLSRGYIKVDEKVLYEEGLNGIDEKITDLEYSTPSNERAVLSYPLENLENFYMTLWVVKFSKPANNSLKSGTPQSGAPWLRR